MLKLAVLLLLACIGTVAGDCDIFTDQCDGNLLTCLDTDDMAVDDCIDCDVYRDGNYQSYQLLIENPVTIRVYQATGCQGMGNSEVFSSAACQAANTDFFVDCGANNCGSPECVASDGGDGDGSGFDDDFCPKFDSCADEGDSCEICVAGVDAVCENYCPNECNSTCLEVPDVDTQCFNDGNCDVASYLELDRGYRLECLGGTCRKIVEDTENKMYPGDECTANSDDCRNGNDVSCVDGECVGQDEGFSCQSDDVCNPGLTCSSGSCVKLRSGGDTCDDDDLECEYDYVCVREDNQNVCAKIASRGEGDLCAGPDDDDNDIACEDGTYCKDGTCRKYSFVDPDDEKSCNDNDDCGEDGVCACDHNTGELVCVAPNADCKSEIESYQSCLMSNDCNDKSSTSIPGACAYENCRGAAKDFALCANNARNDGDASDLFPDGCYNSGASLLSWISALFY